MQQVECAGMAADLIQEIRRTSGKRRSSGIDDAVGVACRSADFFDQPATPA
jgi:hypothetical protein